jgi:hyperosmotically inducible protein
MRRYGMLLLGLLPLCGCDQQAATPTPSQNAAVPKDNTAVNERDREPAAKTPIDQDENTTDVTVTAEIRKEIVAQRDFSVNAQNAKVITSQGRVTLRGPVASQQEADTIVKIAEKVAGPGKVDNQLEIAP